MRPRFGESLRWLDAVSGTIPAGCSTLAKTPWRGLPGTTAICCVEASGARFTDLDGNSWLDCEMAMGTAVWGHARAEVEQAVIAQLRRGVSYSLPAPIELELARRLLERFGAFDSVRFCKSGADAVTGAVRMARACTGREVVVATAYHGWHDWSAYGYYGQRTQELGIPRHISDSTRWVGDTRREAVEQAIAQTGEDCACLVVCPDRWRPADLAVLVAAGRRAGALVIFDEVTSGIRAGRRATAGEYGLWPDLLCVSKGMANGLPLAAVLGPAALLEHATAVRFSNAHSSECLALAAALACEDLLAKAGEWPSWRQRTDRMLDRICAEINDLGLAGSLLLDGSYASFSLRTAGAADFWSDPFRAHLIGRLARDGIYSKGYLVFSDAHSAGDLDLVEASVLDAIRSWRIR